MKVLRLKEGWRLVEDQDGVGVRREVERAAADVAAEPIVNLWDLAPILVIVEEAGGRFTNLEGERTADGVSAVSTNGHLHDEVLAALNDPAVKDRLKNEVEAAIKLGVFGSPYIVIDGEPFWDGGYSSNPPLVPLILAATLCLGICPPLALALLKLCAWLIGLAWPLLQGVADSQIGRASCRERVSSPV